MFFNVVLVSTRTAMCACKLSLSSLVWLFVICQASLSTGFSRQAYWSGFASPPAGDLPDPGIKPMSLMSPALAGGLFITSTNWEAPNQLYVYGMITQKNFSKKIFMTQITMMV